MLQPFTLTPQESFLYGVHLEDETLSFSASGTQVVQAIAMLTLETLLAVGLVVSSLNGSLDVGGTLVNDRAAGAWVGVGLLVVAVVLTYVRVRPRVEADCDGLSIRSAWSTRRVGWAAVSDVAALETTRKRAAVLGGPGWIGLRMRAVTSWSVGVLVLSDGGVLQLPCFVAASRGEGLSLGGATSTEIKVAALQRFRMHCLS